MCSGMPVGFGKFQNTIGFKVEKQFLGSYLNILWGKRKRKNFASLLFRQVF